MFGTNSLPVDIDEKTEGKKNHKNYSEPTPKVNTHKTWCVKVLEVLSSICTSAAREICQDSCFRIVYVDKYAFTVFYF